MNDKWPDSWTFIIVEENNDRFIRTVRDADFDRFIDDCAAGRGYDLEYIPESGVATLSFSADPESALDSFLLDVSTYAHTRELIRNN